MASTSSTALVKSPLSFLTPSNALALLGRLRTVNLGKATRRLATLLVALVFLLNARSWPLFWHFKIFKPVYLLRLSHTLATTRVLLSTPTRKQKGEDGWWENYALTSGCVGAHPMEFRSNYKDWVSFDDGDFNGHMSNSSYPKILDSVRFKAALEMFPIFFRAGGWIPLAGTQFRFCREIPMLKSYEVWSSVLTWDEKWMYVLHKFTSRAKPKDGEETINGQPVFTVAVSQICFKIGRITVPPALVLAVNGFTATPTLLKGQAGWTEGGKGAQCVETPEWKRVKDMMHFTKDGHPKKLTKFLCGGWREEKEKAGTVWWEQVFADLEAKRVANLDLIRPLDMKQFV